MTKMQRFCQTIDGKGRVDLRHWIPRFQLAVLFDCCAGEEGAWFLDRLKALSYELAALPLPYAQDGKGDAAMVSAHYFAANSDWWIIERDSSEEQRQAFGLARVNGHDAELGYISIHELLSCRVELDLHWTPCTLGDLHKRCCSMRYDIPRCWESP